MKRIKQIGDLGSRREVESLENKINELVDKVNQLEKTITKIQAREFFDLHDNNGPGEIGWNNGEFYKD